MKTRLGLLILALALGLVLAWQWHDWSPPAPGPSEARSALPAAGASPSPAADPRGLLLPLEDKGKYENIIARPLFLMDRRPPKEAPAAEAPAEPEPKSPSNLARLNLNAVLITPSESFAWVQDPAQQVLVKLRPGDELEGWSVHEIRSDQVLLERQGERDTLVLRDYKNQPPPWKKPTARRRTRPSPRTADKGMLRKPGAKRPDRKPPAGNQ